MTTDKTGSESRCTRCNSGVYVRSWGDISCFQCGDIPVDPDWTPLPWVPDRELEIQYVDEVEE